MTGPARRTVGGVEVSAVALGTAMMGFTAVEDDPASLAVLRCALEEGIDVLDTALAYTGDPRTQHAERLVGEAARAWPGEVRIATKGGHLREGPDGWPLDGRPEALRSHCQRSLTALGVERIWLYFLHWPDPSVPIEESVGALADLQAEGLIEHVGVSNVDVELLRRARSAATVAAVQNHWSYGGGGDPAVLQQCTDDGIPFFAWSPFGGGGEAKTLAQRVPALVELAASRGVSVHRLALAALLATSPVMLPLVGGTRLETVRDSAAALRLDLTPEERDLLLPTPEQKEPSS